MEKITEFIFEAVQEILKEKENMEVFERKVELKLYGANGVLDSFGLVALLVSLEERIEDELGKEVSLADAKAMSAQNSPFATVLSLKEYIESKLSV